MQDVKYDPQHIARAFDEYGDREWTRHDLSPMGRVAFHLHRHYLHQFVRSGERVLEVGAGAGRFTVEMARLGARVTVTDISPGQLALNRLHVGEEGLETFVDARQMADIIDLSAFEPASFDAVVCYGGPISYALGEAERGLDELLRVAKPGAPVLLSVMSHCGSLRAYLHGVDIDWKTHGGDAVKAVFDTGDLPQALSGTGPMHMFKWHELEQLLLKHGCEIVVASAANYLSAGMPAAAVWLDDPERKDVFLEWERSVCAERGALDGGTHIIVVVRRP